ASSEQIGGTGEDRAGEHIPASDRGEICCRSGRKKRRRDLSVSVRRLGSVEKPNLLGLPTVRSVKLAPPGPDGASAGHVHSGAASLGTFGCCSGRWRFSGTNSGAPSVTMPKRSLNSTLTALLTLVSTIGTSVAPAYASADS